MMKKIFIALFLISVFFTADSVFAQSFKLAQPSGLGVPVEFKSTPSAEGIVQRILVNVISLFFAIGGIGVVIYFIWGAVDWIMAGGDKEKISNARKKMTNAIIGLVLLALSLAIIRTVGAVAGFDPLGNLQIKGLGDPNQPVKN